MEVRVRLSTADPEATGGTLKQQPNRRSSSGHTEIDQLRPNQIFLAALSSSHAPPHADQVTGQPTGGGVFAQVLITPAVFQP